MQVVHVRARVIKDVWCNVVLAQGAQPDVCPRLQLYVAALRRLMAFRTRESTHELNGVITSANILVIGCLLRSAIPLAERLTVHSSHGTEACPIRGDAPKSGRSLMPLRLDPRGAHACWTYRPSDLVNLPQGLQRLFGLCVPGPWCHPWVPPLGYGGK